MIPRTKKAKTFLTALFVAVALVVVLAPTAALGAQPSCVNYAPWRGSWFARIYVYAKGDILSADPYDYYSWMEVHAYLYEKVGGYWYLRAENVDGGEDCSYVSCTARYYHPSSDTFKTLTFHDWDKDGGTYEAVWMESVPTYLPS